MNGEFIGFSGGDMCRVLARLQVLSWVGGMDGFTMV